MRWRRGRQGSSSGLQAELCGSGDRADTVGVEMVTGRGEAAPGLAAAPAPARSASSSFPGWKERRARHLRGVDVSPVSCSWWCCACIHASCSPLAPVRDLGLACLFPPISLLLAVRLVSRQSLKKDVHASTKKSIILFNNCIVCSEST